MMLREVLLRKGIPWRNPSGSDELSLNCPFCQRRGEVPDTKFRFYVNLISGYAYCHNCQFKTRHGFSALLRQLGMQDLQIDGETQAPQLPPETPRLPQDFQRLTRIDSDLDKMAYDYLRQRGITQEQIKENQIGVSFVGRLAYRIIFPVREDAELLGVVARDFTGQQQPKYLNSFGQKGLYHGKKGLRAVISEGIFKALRIDRLHTGFVSMALLGRDITESQLEQLKRYECKEIVIWPDPDYPGRQGAIKVAEKLIAEGYLVGVVWPVHQAADEEPLEKMSSTWKQVEAWSWGLRQRLLGG